MATNLPQSEVGAQQEPLEPTLKGALS